MLIFHQIWGDVLRAKKPPEDRPELLISLTHLPQAERISITIMKARNLSVDHDPFVRVSLYAKIFARFFYQELQRRRKINGAKK